MAQARGTVVRYTENIVIEDCYLCGIKFGMPRDFRRDRIRDQRDFYCPNGHDQHYIGKTEEQKQRERAERAESHAIALHDQLQATERSRQALRGVVTRTKRRAAAGVCPVDGCKRHFQNVQRHVERMHPGYSAEVER